MDPDALSLSQQAAVAQLQALTNGGDVEVAIGVLASVDWDVQVSFRSLRVLLCAAGRCGGCSMVFGSVNCTEQTSVATRDCDRGWALG